jgi:hypothetical protein
MRDTRRLTIRCAIGAVGLGITVLPMRATSPAEDAQPCRLNCNVAMERIMTLKHDRGPEFLPDASVPLVRHESGRIVTVTRQRDQLVIFDATGRMLSVVGKFQSIAGFVTKNDGTLAAYDRRARLLYDLSRDWQVGAARPFPQRPAIHLGDGSFLISALLTEPSLVGIPLHILSPEGKRVKSFGESGVPYRSSEGYLHQRIVAMAADRSIMTAIPGKYVLERWDVASGRKVTETKVKEPWFFDQTGTPLDTAKRPPPFVEMIWADKELVWVLVRVADQNWKAPASLAERRFDAVEHDQSHDWLIQAVDFSSGMVLAEKRLATAHWPAGPQPLLASAAGRGMVHVDRPTLVQKEGRE